MKYVSIILISLIFVPCIVKAQFIQNSSRSLFSDVKAFKEGDAITVLIVEDTQADNTASTNNGRSTTLSGGINFGNANSNVQGDIGLKSGNEFKGNGQTTRKETIKSRLSAQVKSVEENGNLKIEGTRETIINGENQTIFISGIVRPVDVQSNNTIYSYSILDLKLYIKGKGTVSEIQEPGLITKFLRFLF